MKVQGGWISEFAQVPNSQGPGWWGRGSREVALLGGEWCKFYKRFRLFPLPGLSPERRL